MKDKIFQSQICVCAASINLICAKGSAEMREIYGIYNDSTTDIFNVILN